MIQRLYIFLHCNLSKHQTASDLDYIMYTINQYLTVTYTAQCDEHTIDHLTGSAILRVTGRMYLRVQTWPHFVADDFSRFALFLTHGSNYLLIVYCYKRNAMISSCECDVCGVCRIWDEMITYIHSGVPCVCFIAPLWLGGTSHINAFATLLNES